MTFDKDKMYIVEGGLLAYVEYVMQRLYDHDWKRLNADESRDIANALHARLHSGLVIDEYKPNEKDKK